LLYDLGPHVRTHQSQNLGEDFVHEATVVCNYCHAEDGPLPRVEIADLGNGDVVPRENAVLQALHDLAPRLEGSAFANEDMNLERSDYHDASTARLAYRRLAQCSRNLLDVVDFYEIARLDVVEPAQADPTLKSGLDFPNVVLESL
jgi:hypothetical protein